MKITEFMLMKEILKSQNLSQNLPNYKKLDTPLIKKDFISKKNPSWNTYQQQIPGTAQFPQISLILDQLQVSFKQMDMSLGLFWNMERNTEHAVKMQKQFGDMFSEWVQVL